jgi:hypothetical protein
MEDSLSEAGADSIKVTIFPPIKTTMPTTVAGSTLIFGFGSLMIFLRPRL